MLLKLNDDECWFVSGLRDDRDKKRFCSTSERSRNYLDTLWATRGLFLKDPLEAVATHSNIRIPAVLMALNAEIRI